MNDPEPVVVSTATEILSDCRYVNAKIILAIIFLSNPLTVTLGQTFKNKADARYQQLIDNERLLYHYRAPELVADLEYALSGGGV